MGGQMAALEIILRRSVVLIASFLSVVLLLVIIGEERERRAWLERTRTSPSGTLPLYATPERCMDDRGRILNCGHCGKCSNRNDIRVYRERASTLTTIMTECAKRGVFWGGPDATHRCLLDRVDLTPECAACWVLNAECNKRHCLSTCIKHRLLPAFLPSISNDWEAEGRLDACHACDESFCGAAFVQCAGANRRRVGVVSDIKRDAERELCASVDWEWILGTTDENEEEAASSARVEHAKSGGEGSGEL